ncbi:MAG: Rieske (2Fe-2S) protein, partial [Lacipirellulaceae bacterium]
MPFVTALRVGELAEGEGRTVVIGDRLVALFLVGDEYLAIDDLCPHQGASLGAGCLDHDERHGVTVVCPWHAWRFRLSDGKWADNP